MADAGAHYFLVVVTILLMQDTTEKPSALKTSVGSISSRSAVVNWTQPVLKPSQVNITSYIINYWNHSAKMVMLATSQDRSKKISGLSVCTEYNVSITSHSSLGSGILSDLKTFRTDSEKPVVAPGNVTAQARTSQSILLTWQVPVGVRCPQTGYKVTYTKTAGGQAQTETVSGGSSTSKNLTGLDKWTDYSITVQVGNDKGFGPASKAVTDKTFEDKPDAPPQNLVATAKSCTQIDVSWNPPPADKQNGVIRGYKLSYCKTGQCSSSTVRLATNTSITLKDRAMFTQYTIKVLAYTNVDYGPYSNSVTVRTHEGPPYKPTNVTYIVSPGKTGPSVKVQWNIPSSPNGIIRGYKVSYGLRGDENTRSFDNNTLTYTFDACSGMTYKVRVWAFTVADGDKEERTIVVSTYDTLPQRKGKSSTNKILLIGLAAITGIQLVFNLVLMDYIRYLRNKVKELLTKRNYEEQSPQEEIIYENSTVCKRQPEVDIQMNDVTTTVVPEYDFVDTSPKFPPNSNGLKSLNKSSQIGKQSLPSHGDNNISTRPVSNANKRGTPAHQNEPPTSQGNRSAFGKVSIAIERFDMNKPSEHTAPSAARQVDQLKTARKPSIPPKPMVKPSPYQIVQLNSKVSNVSVRSPKKVNNNASSGPIPSKRRPDIPVLLPSCSSHHKPLSCNVTNNILTGREPSGDYQQLDPSKLIQDSGYEKLNKGTMSKNR